MIKSFEEYKRGNYVIINGDRGRAWTHEGIMLIVYKASITRKEIRQEFWNEKYGFPSASHISCIVSCI